MACPLTISKFVGTISLGLLTGNSFSSAAVTIPSLNRIPSASHASKALYNLKRLNRKYSLRQANISNVCLLFAYSLSSKHRKHPYLIWMCAMSTIASYGVDYWFHRHDGFKNWVRSVIQDTDILSICCSKNTQQSEEDIVVVEAEEDMNGEIIQNAMNAERRLQGTRMVFSGIGFVMGIVGLWGERRP